MARAALSTNAANGGECDRVSRPMCTTILGNLPLLVLWYPVAYSLRVLMSINACFDDGAFANDTACCSQAASSIPPCESANFIPLSGSGLCDAVIMAPTSSPPREAERRAVKMPMRTKQHGKRLAS